MGVSGQRHAPAALYSRGKDTRYPLNRRLGTTGQYVSLIMKLLRPNKMYPNDTIVRSVWVNTSLTNFPLRIVWKKGNYETVVFEICLEYAVRRGGGGCKMRVEFVGHMSFWSVLWVKTYHKQKDAERTNGLLSFHYRIIYAYIWYHSFIIVPYVILSYDIIKCQ
jgi:hypothetical protein